MIPLRDSTPHSRFPVVTVGLIALNAVVFILQLAGTGPDPGRAFLSLGLVPARLTGHDPFAGTGLPPPWLGLAAGMFLHGGFMHLAGNMWFLWLFGDNVEDRMGRGRFLAFYFLCGLVASAAHVALNPSSKIPTIGASGAIAGVMGAYLILYPRARIKTLIWYFAIVRFVDIPAILFLGLWFLLQLFSGVVFGFSTDGDVGGIAFWAHVGGFLAGMAILRAFVRGRLRPPA